MNITHQTEQNVFQFKPPVIVYNPNVSSRNGLGLNNEAVNSDGSDMCEEEKGGSEPKGEDPKTIFQFVANMSPQAFKSDGSPITDFKPAPVTGRKQRRRRQVTRKITRESIRAIKLDLGNKKRRELQTFSKKN